MSQLRYQLRKDQGGIYVIYDFTFAKEICWGRDIRDMQKILDQMNKPYEERVSNG